MTLSPGDAMPDFDLPTDGGGRISSAQLKGRPYVLYLYPKDDTPGCTLEAQTFASRYGEFEAIGFEVVGLSKDSVSSHDRFKRKCGLSFPLASDEDGRLVEALGSWVEKSNYGKTYMGIDRSTFLVNAEGVIVRTWRGVKVPGHVEDVLAAATEVGH
ncbi:peroxiredoxin [Geminicoccus harenae]|uniref:peroxiredoxin n=1 Tax=Geminicoccus harenae TaxID=2498453 RepID=UPI001C948BCC|nr:peroxiredoxin [Geminicoccus harenae]